MPSEGPESGPALRGGLSVALAFSLATSFASFLLLSHNPADLDVWARLAVGRLVEASGDAPRIDPFAFTPKKDAWIDHEWLSGVVFDVVARGFGGAGLTVLKLALVALTLSFLIAARRARSPAATTGAAVLLPVVAWTIEAWTNTVRSHVFTLLLVAVFAWALTRYERGGRTAWLVPLAPLCFAWAQLHGGVLVGLGMILVSLGWTAWRDRSLRIGSAVVVALAIGALFVGPYGPAYVRFLADAVSMPRPGIREWEPLAILSGDALVPVGILVLFVAGALADREARRAAGAGVPIVLLAAWFAFRHQRHVPLFLLLAYAYGADLVVAPFAHVARAFRWPRQAIARVAAVAAGVATAVLLWLCGARLATGGAVPDVSWYPVDACRWLAREGPGGRLLVGFNEGSYALWRLHPRYLVSLDGRYEEVYPESTKELVVHALDPGAPGHAAALAAIAPDAILARREEVDGTFDGYSVVYRDARFDVWVRGEAPAVPDGPEVLPADAVDPWVPPPWR